jgi:hypothetical protein
MFVRSNTYASLYGVIKEECSLPELIDDTEDIYVCHANEITDTYFHSAVSVPLAQLHGMSST